MRALLIASTIVLAAFIFSFPVVLFLQHSRSEPAPQASSPTEAPAPALPVPPSTLLFVGDVMLDRSVALHAKEKGDASLFAGVTKLFTSADAVVANLEGAITEYPSVAVPYGTVLRFTFDPRFARVLREQGITVVSLSNNHTDDFGREGYAQTKNHLSEAGISFFGSPDNTELSTQLQIRDKNICFVGYEGFINASTTPVAKEIQRLRPLCAFLVATMHDGTEYIATSTAHQQNAAHTFVDAGADLIIGTHPHVVQPLEIYKGKAIFYSLGNFIFDQSFSWATKHGLAVRAELSDAETRFTLFPITIERAEASLSTADDGLRTLARLIDRAVPFETASDILNTSSFILR